MSQPVDRERYRASMARLYGIFQEMSETVSEVSKRRCPYKNVQDRCTAAFGCRNQRREGPPGSLPLCVGSDDLDYRSAWMIDESSP